MVFREYGWTYREWLDTPYWLWEELLVILKAKSDAELMKTRAKQPGTTEDLIATAMQEGFDVPAEVLRDYQKRGA